ncbi:transporter substrate-binding domain-containing protein [Pseudomonas sp. PDM14]|uniref:substrate-binding periplasmic protein n=1 Tax=Pseudomonas sp. PDM14 TaxID=2769288 RepID=UPI00177F517A|nr:transporter substrate-binding domain-containing protein [Pseudomonas sp. PDM14]MBD9484811.1 transporter substrate-binding domain-containing protein [Pseudomonas sp. PDM14]
MLSRYLTPGLALAGRLIALLLCTTTLASAADVLRYPRAPAGEEYRQTYALAQLQLALDKADSPLRLEPSEFAMEQERALLSLEEGRAVDVVWTMTSVERERRLLPVRIGIDKGLFGWRVALLRQDRPDLLREVRNLADLQSLRAGQGHDWPDTDILRWQGLPVVVTASYDSLFRMLAAGRFDYFPRSVLEAWDEVQHNPQAGAVIDPHLVLRYPTACYFFFSPRNPQLAATVRRGMEKALADGSFDRLFLQHYGPLLRQARLDQRQLIELHNPLLPAATPLQRKALWFSRDDLRALPRP